jgi:signal transduction histidine kinase
LRLARLLASLALAAVVVGALATVAILRSNHVDHRGLVVGFGLAIGASWIGTGLFAWWRRPANRFGALMTFTGFAWLVNGFTAANSPAVFTFAVLFSSLYLAAFVHLLLAYPEGRIESRQQRRLVAFTYGLATVGPLPMLLFGVVGMDTQPRSVFELADRPRLGSALDGLTSGLAVVLVVYVLWLLASRWRVATLPQRRAMAPLLWSGMALMALVAVTLGAETFNGAGHVTNVFALLSQIVFASVPFTFLFALMRSRMAQGDAVGELLLALGRAPGTGGLRGLLADALHDRSLQLLYWIDGRWVDRQGHAAALPADRDPARAWTAVELEGNRVGAIVHDASLAEAPEALRSVAAAAGLAVENERLQAALGARVEELRRSRARIVEAAFAERRRLERNLHDGAQQRLVALSLSLRLAHRQIRKAPEQAEALVAAAQEELTRALQELRELARGIHPAVLSDRGLQAAVEALAVRSPLPVRVVEVPGERLPEPVEAAVYFVIAEALTNVAKYADATEATVSVRRRNGHAVVEVSDDGVGGADPDLGSGLRGLADRVGALDGSLSLDSPPGTGTTLTAEIPV